MKLPPPTPSTPRFRRHIKRVLAQVRAGDISIRKDRGGYRVHTRERSPHDGGDLSYLSIAFASEAEALRHVFARASNTGNDTIRAKMIADRYRRRFGLPRATKTVARRYNPDFGPVYPARYNPDFTPDNAI